MMHRTVSMAGTSGFRQRAGRRGSRWSRWWCASRCCARRRRQVDQGAYTESRPSCVPFSCNLRAAQRVQERGGGRTPGGRTLCRRSWQRLHLWRRGLAMLDLRGVSVMAVMGGILVLTGCEDSSGSHAGPGAPSLSPSVNASVSAGAPSHVPADTMPSASRKHHAHAIAHLCRSGRGDDVPHSRRNRCFRRPLQLPQPDRHQRGEGRCDGGIPAPLSPLRPYPAGAGAVLLRPVRRRPLRRHPFRVHSRCHVRATREHAGRGRRHEVLPQYVRRELELRRQ